ncbi:MAG: hypothetical protein KIT56_00495 [Gammaproteobacteria bacterium]|nr:hypothetical protein [Gammaproteobacteria bacterium]MCW5582365.1 hypothetical protein [Gammaproteobacteria bacterium]
MHRSEIRQINNKGDIPHQEVNACTLISVHAIQAIANVSTEDEIVEKIKALLGPAQRGFSGHRSQEHKNARRYDCG